MAEKFLGEVLALDGEVLVTNGEVLASVRSWLTLSDPTLSYQQVSSFKNLHLVVFKVPPNLKNPKSIKENRWLKFSDGPPKIHQGTYNLQVFFKITVINIH